ncbi:MAG: hypothetical protein CVT94_05030 [Bacteroidetes bacterium HGW-Bacteroidetes-11]|jgi:cob(I)alamin adenosyltransferase|nr:MAG: hypothetical protein CVT94_05030 [Bacteroidetes bacterium HGW-Bacteroidetes-11]
MKRIAAITGLIILLTTGIGCNRSAKHADGTEVIPRDQMVKIMTDVEMTEASLRFLQSKVNKDSLDKIAHQSFDSLYVFYNITPVQFKRNLEIYQKDLADFEKMMDEVMLAITKAKDSLSNTLEIPTDTLAVVKK